jgi:DNA-binding transcriptional LysR family regulator
VKSRPRLFADESTALVGAAEAGLGIAALPQVIARPARDSGKLAPVLPKKSLFRKVE